jgi:type IV pilus assembly protein PilV
LSGNLIIKYYQEDEMKIRDSYKKKTGDRGFSLIEMLVSIVILSVSLLALASLMAMTTRNNSSGAQITEAINFAQDKIEELGVTPWGNLLSGVDQKKGSNGTRYTRNWTILPNATGNLRAVNVIINWNDRKDHSIRLLSAISQ